VDYELAKKLKDAGYKFPANDGCANCWGDLGQGCSEECGKEHCPTLSELIEACGDGFGKLEKHRPNIGWGAYADNGIDEFGLTPEEAVARLWLALNKK